MIVGNQTHWKNLKQRRRWNLDCPMKTPPCAILASLAVIAGCAHPEQRQKTLVTDPLLPASRPIATTAASPKLEGPPVQSHTGAVYNADLFSPRASDNEIIRKLRVAINEDASLRDVAPAISAGSSEGTVLLSGTVRSGTEKDRAETLAREIVGVRAVENQLKVASIATAPPDSAAADVIAGARVDGDQVSDVRQRGGVSGSALKSGVEASSVSVPAPVITGTDQGGVDSIAEQISGGAVGGINVQVLGSNATDQTLAQKISEELRSDASLAAALSHVQVEVQDAKLFLKGNVRNEVQKREIENAISRVTPGVVIDNQLRVSGNTDSLPYNP